MDLQPRTADFLAERLRDLPYVVEPMQTADIGEVMAIDRQSFPTPWSHSAYVHEIERNDAAHYLVLRAREGVRGPGSDTNWERVKRWLAGSGPSGRLPILAYGGLWLMYDEAHISTIAARSDWRGKGVGELMLVALLDQALRLTAHIVTLEVRVSNTRAQRLYKKYHLEVVGRRRGYYTDNNEDALLMTTPPLDDSDYQTALARLADDLRARLLGQTEPLSGVEG